MVEITFKIDGKDQVSISQNGELVSLKTHDQYDENEKVADETFLSTDTYSNKKSMSNKIRQKKLSSEKYMYENIKYIKVDDLFLRVFHDDSCEKIASSTYYKYKARQNNES